MYRIEITNNGMTEVLHDVNTNSYRRAASGIFTRDLYAVHSATITIYPQNPCFEHLHELTTLVKIINTKTGKIMFDGHILQIPDNSMTDGGKFEKKLLCESELGYLCDSTQLLYNYGEVDNTSFLAGCLDFHNEQMAQSPERQILLGAVSQHGMHQKATSYRSTMEEFKQNLISVNGGILDLQRNANQKLVLNYWQDSDYGNVCNTKIELAHNLKSLTLGTDMTGVITRLFPLGAVVNSETGERLTVSSVNGNCPYIDDLEAIGKWGIKTGTVTFDDVTDPSILLSRGREHILTVNQAKRTFQANVLDLSTIGADADEFDIGNQYLFDVNQMVLHEYLRVTQMTVDIYKPYQPQITIGDKLERITDIATQTRNYIAYEAPKQYSSILQQAKTNASALIAAATTGYVVLYPNDCPREILIMDTDDIHTAKSVWRMNRNGIGYSHSDVAGEAYNGEYGIAMTMDGAIVADFITAGHLFADRIRGGTLTVGGSEAGGNGVISVLDDAGNEICRLDKYGASIFGEVYTKNKDGYWLRLANGSLTGGESGVTTATIDTSAVVVDGDHGISYHGLQFSSDVVYFDCDFFAINEATGTTGGLTVVDQISFSFTNKEIVTGASIDGNGDLQLTKEVIQYVSGYTIGGTTFYFRNGIMCTELDNSIATEDDYNTPQAHGSHDGGTGGDGTPVDGGVVGTGLLAKMKKTGYVSGQTTIANLGTSGNSFTAGTYATASNIYQDSAGIGVKEYGYVLYNQNWQSTPYTVIIALHFNQIITGSLSGKPYARIICNAASQFEIFIPLSPSGVADHGKLVYTLAQGVRGTAVSTDVSLPTYASVWMVDNGYPSSSLEGQDIEFRLVNDGNTMHLYVNGSERVCIASSIFSRNTSGLRVGPGDGWVEAEAPDMVIKKFEIYSGVIEP